MKELIKPNQLEKAYCEIETLTETCTTHCRRCSQDEASHCNRYCTGGSTNESPIDDMDILF